MSAFVATLHGALDWNSGIYRMVKIWRHVLCGARDGPAAGTIAFVLDGLYLPTMVKARLAKRTEHDERLGSNRDDLER